MVKKIIGGIVNTIIIILVVIVLGIGIIFTQSMLNPNVVPNLFGYKPFVVLSGSMETKINKGDLVFVKVVDYNTLKKRDVVAFRNPDNFVTTHRIVDIISDDGNKRYITKGDANNIVDPYSVTNENMEGKYIGKISGLGDIILILQSPITLIVSLVIIGLIAIIFVLSDKISKKKDITDNNTVSNELESQDNDALVNNQVDENVSQQPVLEQSSVEQSSVSNNISN